MTRNRCKIYQHKYRIVNDSIDIVPFSWTSCLNARNHCSCHLKTYTFISLFW